MFYPNTKHPYRIVTEFPRYKETLIVGKKRIIVLPENNIWLEDMYGQVWRYIGPEESESVNGWEQI
jgi:hypothetical protein